MLSEIKSEKRQMLCKIPIMCGISKNKNKKQKPHRCREQDSGCQIGGGGSGMGEIGKGSQKVKRKTKSGAPGCLSQLNVYLLILPQVMTSQFVGSSPMLGSVLEAWSPLGILSLPLSLSLLLPHSHCVCFSQNK